MGQANTLVEYFDSPFLGVVADVYHIWWDPDLDAQIARAAGHTSLASMLNDWLSPPPDILLGRGMIGDGVIDIRRIRGLVDAAG